MLNGMTKRILYIIPPYIIKRFKEYYRDGVFCFPHRISLPSDCNYTYKHKSVSRPSFSALTPLEMPNANAIKAYDLMRYLEDKFYDEFYLFVDIKAEVGYRYTEAIAEFMRRYGITEEDIKTETLIKRHFRYRKAKEGAL